MSDSPKPPMTLAAFCTTVCVIFLGILDLVVCLRNGTDASISRFLQDTAFGSPLVTFVFGFVAGHLFGYLRPSKRYRDGDDK